MAQRSKGPFGPWGGRWNGMRRRRKEEEEGGTTPHAEWESFVEPEISLLSLPWTGCGLGLAPGSQGIVEE